MIFSDHVRTTVRQKLPVLLDCAGEPKRTQIRKALESAARTEREDVVLAAAWILASSPLSDLANYDFDLYLSCARHGVFLREHSPFAREVPEEIFLNDVLHIRVNEEELCDCRRGFYDQLAARLDGLSMHDAVLEVNYWNAEQVCYQATDERTISALGAYRSGYGRCGEESAFGVNVFRAVGIPARQIYTPRWAHCDDNHAWIEVYCDGEWQFLGACEPEEVLNRGWFTNASSRAMVIHSRCFGESTAEEQISRSGVAAFLNQIRRYAVARTLSVLVRDADGNPVQDAKVAFEILNYSDFFDAAVVRTGTDGIARLTCGQGSLNIRASKGSLVGEKLVFTPDADLVELTLLPETVQTGEWKDFVFRAPRDRIVNGRRPTEEQKALGLRKTAAASALRERRAAGMFDRTAAENLVSRYGYSGRMVKLLSQSRGNAPRLMEFLQEESCTPEEKEAVLWTLSQKDLRDVDPEVLLEALELGRPYREEAGADYMPYVVCPRVQLEPLRKCRREILRLLSEERKYAFRADPRRIWEWMDAEIGFDPSVEYGQIVTGALGAMTVKNASPLSRKILFVTICRTLGIPARMNPVNELAEFRENGTFVPVEPVRRGSCTLTLHRETGSLWQYGTDFGVAVLRDGQYQQLNLWKEPWDGDEMRLNLHPGTYRLLTDNRLPNGDVHASSYLLKLEEGESADVRLRKYPADLREMLDHLTLEEFRVLDADGSSVTGTELTGSKAILMWLDVGMEPTEHILNEMLEQQADFRSAPAELVFVLRGPEALENDKLRQVLAAIPRIRICYDSFVPNVETLARRMYVDPEKLPLILVTTGPLDAVYACSGYNVGSGDLILKICKTF